MKIACLQFAPEMHKRDENMAKANALLLYIKPGDIDLLVLPEMAFTGKASFTQNMTLFYSSKIYYTSIKPTLTVVQATTTPTSPQ